MSLFRKKTEDNSDIHYEGHVVPRMLSYLKPHMGTVAVCLVLVLIITGLELYKPIVILAPIFLFFFCPKLLKRI